MKIRIIGIALVFVLAACALAACGSETAEVETAPDVLKSAFYTVQESADAQATAVERGDNTLPESTSAQTSAPGNRSVVAPGSASDRADTTAAQAQETVQTDATRTLAYYAGSYVADRCGVYIKPISENEAEITIHWANSAFESVDWTMTGYFDPDTYRLTYSDCRKTQTDYTEEETGKSTVEYENGAGRFQLQTDHSMQWQDEQENAGAGLQFTFIP